jgi:hypothetical protein
MNINNNTNHGSLIEIKDDFKISFYSAKGKSTNFNFKVIINSVEHIVKPPYFSCSYWHLAV